MPTLTEKNHPAEFLVAEVHPDLSRELGTLQAGQNVVDGQVVKLLTGKLVTAISADVTVEGIIIGNWNVSVDTKVPYVARLAAAKSSLVKVISGGSLIQSDPDRHLRAWKPKHFPALIGGALEFIHSAAGS